MRPSDLAPLSVVVTPDDRASAVGFLLQAALANGMTLADLWAALELGHRGRPGPEHVALLAWYTHAPAPWLAWRIPAVRRWDGSAVVDLFGQLWSSTVALRRRRAQHCHLCLRAHAPIAIEWDLSCFCACPEHGVILQDHCHYCGHSIELFRPGWDVCNCGHYLTTSSHPPLVADLWTIRWCEWVSHALRPEAQAAPALPREFQALLCGLSVDGASRLVMAFGGGQRALDSARLSAAQRWLTTRTVNEVVAAGMRRLGEFLESRHLPQGVPALALDDLMKLAVSGLTATDRARAAWLIGLIKGRRVPLRVRRATSRQLDLFADQEKPE